MLVVVLFVALSFVLMGAAALIQPRWIKAWVAELRRRGWIWPLVALRLVLGLLLLAAAPQTRMPGVVAGFGVLLLAAALAVPLVGRERVWRLADWWLARPDGLVRAWGVIASAIGAFLAWAAC